MIGVTTQLVSGPGCSCSSLHENLSGRGWCEQPLSRPPIESFVVNIASNLNELSAKSLAQTDGPDQLLANHIGVAIRSGPPVLQVAIAILAYLSRYADADVALGHAPREGINIGRLVAASQTASIVGAPRWILGFNVLLLALRERLNGLVDGR